MRRPALASTARAVAALAALCTGLWAAPVQAAPVAYVLDPENSWVHFELMHFGTSTIRGRLGPATGSVRLDREAGRGEIGVQVPTGSVSTGFALFDRRIREPDLLASATHPQAWFVARTLRFEDGRPVELSGELTLRGTSQGLVLKATRFGCHTHPQLRREVCGGDFEGELRRSDFGISFGLPFVADAVKLKVQVEGVRSDGAPAR